jgi:Mg/Co/Ni transporter MgtE
MQELFNSMVRLSAAMTVFGVQQLQTTMGSMDTKDSVEKLREVVDAMADALTSKIDESRRPTVERLSQLPQDIVTRSVDSTREVVQDTSDMLKTTTDWIAGTMKADGGSTSSSEPKPAEEVLSAR